MAHMTRKSSKDCYCCVFYYVDRSVVLQSHEEVTFNATEKTSQYLFGTRCHSSFETFDLDDEGKPIKKKMIYKGILVFSSESKKQCAAVKKTMDVFIKNSSMTVVQELGKELVNMGNIETKKLSSLKKDTAASRLKEVKQNMPVVGSQKDKKDFNDLEMKKSKRDKCEKENSKPATKRKKQQFARSIQQQPNDGIKKTKVVETKGNTTKKSNKKIVDPTMQRMCEEYSGYNFQLQDSDILHSSVTTNYHDPPTKNPNQTGNSISESLNTEQTIAPSTSTAPSGTLRCSPVTTNLNHRQLAECNSITSVPPADQTPSFNHLTANTKHKQHHVFSYPGLQKSTFERTDYSTQRVGKDTTTSALASNSLSFTQETVHQSGSIHGSARDVFNIDNQCAELNQTDLHCTMSSPTISPNNYLMNDSAAMTSVSSSRYVPRVNDEITQYNGSEATYHSQKDWPLVNSQPFKPSQCNSSYRSSVHPENQLQSSVQEQQSNSEYGPHQMQESLIATINKSINIGNGEDQIWENDGNFQSNEDDLNNHYEQSDHSAARPNVYNKDHRETNITNVQTNINRAELMAALGIDLKDLPVVTKAFRGLLNILSETNEETTSAEEMGSAFLESRQGRLIQLIKDPKNPLRYNNILVDAGQLYSLIARAPTSSDPGAFVLNRVISMVFNNQELANSKGTGQRKNSKKRGLNEEKVSACREFVWAVCKEHQWKVPNSDQRIFNNKCTNARWKFSPLHNL